MDDPTSPVSLVTSRGAGWLTAHYSYYSPRSRGRREYVWSGGLTEYFRFDWIFSGAVLDNRVIQNSKNSKSGLPRNVAPWFTANSLMVAGKKKIQISCSEYWLTPYFCVCFRIYTLKGFEFCARTNLKHSIFHCLRKPRAQTLPSCFHEQFPPHLRPRLRSRLRDTRGAGLCCSINFFNFINFINFIRFTAKHVVSGIAGKWGDLPLFVDITMGDYHIPLLAHVVKDLIPIFELPDMSSPLLP